MQKVTAPATPIVRFELDKRCKSCIVPRYLMADVGRWTYESHGPATPAVLEEMIEIRCRTCLDSCLVEPTDAGFTLSIATLAQLGDHDDI